ncbi:hypothetical protein CYY_009143 [Polysphondylium violaceum]|uniref:Uncharacterized protein n=1 Tax=Polysphondylium violaceum TaxID=133409 RepID=A0A8J4PKI5_9MYCE|nr:hypothetical protein CYY_009143 [Polysphondylium violaceum]
MVRLIQQKNDAKESKNFYRTPILSSDLESAYENPFYEFAVVAKDRNKATNDNDKYFWSIFRNSFIKNHIWSFIHKPMIPFKRYKDIYSIKWIFKNAYSVQFLIDKVKRNEYLSDILYISIVLDQFKSINDIEFYTIFDQRYKRYLNDPVMLKVKQFLDSKLNNNDSDKDNNDNNNKKEEQPIIIINNLTNDQKEKDPSYLSRLSLEELLEDYKTFRKRHFNNFKRALESKHLELAQYVLENWLIQSEESLIPRNDYGFIHMGDTEIIKYVCQVNHQNRFDLKVGLGNIYLRDDFEEIMKLLEDSGVIDKLCEDHMNYFKTKRNLEYFIKNGYACDSNLLKSICLGNKMQFDCLPLLMDKIPFDHAGLEKLFYYRSMLPREHIIYKQFFKRYTMDEFKEKYPLLAQRYFRYQEMYKGLYQPDYQNMKTLKDLKVKLKRIGEIGDSSAILMLIRTHYSELLLNYVESMDPYSDNSTKPDYADDGDFYAETELSIEMLLFALIQTSNVPILKMIFQEFPQLLETIYQDQERKKMYTIARMGAGARKPSDTNERGVRGPGKSVAPTAAPTGPIISTFTSKGAFI